MPDPAIADPGLADVALGVIGKVGYTVASIIGLLYVLKWLSGIHLQSLKERFDAMEKELTVRNETITALRTEIRTLNKDALDRSDAHAKVLHELATRIVSALEKNGQYMKQLSAALDDRPCAFPPHPLRTEGASATAPRAPTPLPQPPTSDRIQAP